MRTKAEREKKKEKGVRINTYQLKVRSLMACLSITSVGKGGKQTPMTKTCKSAEKQP